MSEEKEVFLSRWSRLKQEQAAEKAAPPVETKPETAAPAAPLPAVENLTPDSDFKPFMNPDIDLGVRRDALKKLFTDPHFNIPDPFEPYSIDLTGEDPISPELLRTLNHAKRLLFDKPEQTAQAAAEQPETPETPEIPAQKVDDVPGKQDA